MQLPAKFTEKIIELIGKEEYLKYEASLDQNKACGLRVNTLKITPEEFATAFALDLPMQDSIPWTSDGFYYDNSLFPAKNALYHAGLFYLQDPSAMYPGQNLGVEPGDRVLDMCAAPGGKSTKIASELKGQGVLVANDISETRVKALVYNLERWGCKNAIITNESPENLCKHFTGYFNKILIDAPCSGEGMFRKDDEALSAWGKYDKSKFTQIQGELLEYASQLLTPGGTIIYSTCTFDDAEDEKIIEAFLTEHPEFEVASLEKKGGISDGIGLRDAARLWPHRLRGEGHFTCKLKSTSDAEDAPKSNVDYKRQRSYKLLDGPQPEVREFWQKNMTSDIWKGYYLKINSNLYYLPIKPPNLDSLTVARFGLYMGDVEHYKFKPSHQFSLACEKNEFKNNVDFDAKDDAIRRFLLGETITDIDCPNGYAAVRVEGHIIGLVNVNNKVGKNMYPKGWRRVI